MLAVCLTLAALALLGVDKFYRQGRRAERYAMNIANNRKFAVELAEAIEHYNQKQKSRPSL